MVPVLSAMARRLRPAGGNCQFANGAPKRMRFPSRSQRAHTAMPPVCPDLRCEPPEALASGAVAQNPNPLVAITSYAGVTRTLDDWATVFNLAIIVLPDRPEASRFVPVVDRI